MGGSEDGTLPEIEDGPLAGICAGIALGPLVEGVIDEPGRGPEVTVERGELAGTDVGGFVGLTMGTVGAGADPDPEAVLGSDAAGAVTEAEGCTGEDGPEAYNGNVDGRDP